MPKYAFSYFGEPKFQDRDSGGAYKKRWTTWMEEVGAAWVNRGSPFVNTQIVSAEGVSESASASRLTGYSIIETSGMDMAIDLAKRCPHLDHGTVHVSEVMEMEM